MRTAKNMMYVYLLYSQPSGFDFFIDWKAHFFHQGCVCFVEWERLVWSLHTEASTVCDWHRKPSRQYRIERILGQRAQVPGVGLHRSKIEEIRQGRCFCNGPHPYSWGCYFAWLVPCHEYSEISRDALPSLTKSTMRSHHWRSFNRETWHTSAAESVELRCFQRLEHRYASSSPLAFE